MDQVVAALHKNKKHPIEEAAFFHLNFEEAHLSINQHLIIIKETAKKGSSSFLRSIFAHALSKNTRTTQRPRSKSPQHFSTRTFSENRGKQLSLPRFLS
jgi:hypothetical protein